MLPITQSQLREDRGHVLLRECVAGDSARDEQVLHRAQLIFHTVLMSDVNNRREVLFAEAMYVGSIPTNFAFGRPRQTTDDAQQAGLAAAVGTANLDELA